MTDERLFQFEHRAQAHSLDLEGTLAYFAEDAIAHPLNHSTSHLLGQVLAFVDPTRADMARAGQKVDPLGRARFSARLTHSVDIGSIANTETAQLHTLDQLNEAFQYQASLSPDNTPIASMQARNAPQRTHHVAALQGGRLCVGPFGQAVFDSEDRYVDGVCRGDGVLFALCPAQALPPPQYVDATVVSLCSLWGNGYFHWVLEVLPKLLLIVQAGYRLADVDIFLVRQQSPALMEFLSHLGIAPGKVLLWNQLPHLRAKRLIVASSLEHYDYTAKPPSILIEPWASRAMHQRFALPRPSAAKGRRIYIDREQATLRKVINNAEVKAALASYGFECVALETLGLAQKQELFANAEMVVGPAGAGFSNLVLCNPGCAVLIFYQQGFETDSFWSLCNNNQLTHHHLVCEPSQRFYPSESAGTINENFLVDIGTLVQTLDSMTTRLSASH